MSIYTDWGFVQPPFQSNSLPASELGKTLLVGRERELRRVKSRLTNPSKLVTMEGPNGIGKTSLINVASYSCFVESLQVADGPLWIPCHRTFQLNADSSTEEFVDEFFYALAQTLVERSKEILPKKSQLPNQKAIARWLNAPQAQNYSGGIFGIEVGVTTETNTGQGFHRSGFRRIVREWLSTLFPEPGSGGIICLIDNLKLLQTSQAARRRLEELRDQVMTNLPGVRWVLCGALGIILGMTSSPRFDGLLHRPVELEAISQTSIPSILQSRVDVFADPDKSTYPPISSQDFEHLAVLYNGNVRSLLGSVDDYCQWIFDEDMAPSTAEDKHKAYVTWLDELSEQALDAVSKYIKPRAWDVFDVAAKRGGLFAPSDYEEFGFNSMAAIRPHVKDLEDVGLVSSSRDDGDKRRKTIQMCAKGWLVRYARSRGKQ